MRPLIAELGASSKSREGERTLKKPCVHCARRMDSITIGAAGPPTPRPVGSAAQSTQVVGHRTGLPAAQLVLDDRPNAVGFVAGQDLLPLRPAGHLLFDFFARDPERVRNCSA